MDYRYDSSLEAHAIVQFWLVLYGIAMATTLLKYSKKQFADDAVYWRHRRLWWGIILLAAVVHVSVVNLAEGYLCNTPFYGIPFCNSSLIPLISALLMVIAFGPANRQNNSNKGEEGFSIPLVLLSYCFYFQLQWLQFISTNDAIFVIIMCLFPIMLTKLLFWVAELAGFQETLVKLSKFLSFWLALIINVIYFFGFFVFIRERL